MYTAAIGRAGCGNMSGKKSRINSGSACTVVLKKIEKANPARFSGEGV